MVRLALFFALTLQISLVIPFTNATGCEIDPFSDNAPLLIEYGTSSIIYPRYGERTVTFHAGQKVEFSCPQTNVTVGGSKKPSIVSATCISKQNFNIQGATLPWRQVTCSRNPVSTSRYTNGNCGNGNARLAETGFILDASRFLRIMLICFDPKKQTTLYSQFELSATIAESSVGTPRPYFHEDPGFFSLNGMSVNHFYLRKNQRATINHLVGLGSSNTTYVQNGDMYFLARGHLTARADFVYAAQKNATFDYNNAVPQWQSFNGKNWNSAEMDTRNYAISHNASLRVWTGTYGTATLPHSKTNQPTELYLYANSNSRAIPVPAIFWKLVYNPSNKRGIVLIGQNNPYQNQSVVENNVICEDVSDSVKWLNWRKTSIPHGYSYACQVGDFRRVVSYAPNLTVSGLLI